MTVVRDKATANGLDLATKWKSIARNVFEKRDLWTASKVSVHTTFCCFKSSHGTHVEERHTCV